MITSPKSNRHSSVKKREAFSRSKIMKCKIDNGAESEEFEGEVP